jgi:hypothetical protein
MVDVTEAMVEAGCRAMHEAQGTEDADAPLHSPYQNSWDEPDSVRWKQWDETVRAALSAALSAQAEPVEPFGYFKPYKGLGGLEQVYHEDRDDPAVFPLYARPPCDSRTETRILADPCVQKLANDEPFFVLLGRDPDASQALSTWISYRLRSEGRSPKTSAAEVKLDAFRDYQDRALTQKDNGHE